MYLSSLVICFIWVQINYAQELISKCPDVFRYDSSRTVDGRWFGEITLSSDYSLAGYWVELELSNFVEVLGFKYNQPITTKDNKNYVFVTPTDKLEPGKHIRIPFFVKYDLLEAPIPEVASIHINGREICPSQSPKPVGMSPCPGIFSYDPYQPEETGKWYGTIIVNLEYNLRGIFIEVQLNDQAQGIEVYNYRVKKINNHEIQYWESFGDVSTKDNKIFSITNGSFVLPHGRVLSISFFVNYDKQEGPPLVSTVLVNGRIICQDFFKDLQPHIPLVFDTNKLASTSTRIQTTQKPAKSLFTPISTTTRPISIPDIPDINDEEEEEFNGDGYQCGVQEITDKIIRGSTTTIGKHPWHGIIFKEGKYICGMTLISRTHSLSAAHCFYDYTQLPANQSSFTFRFGVDNLNHLNTKSAQIGKLFHIYIHPQYQYHITSYDIAVIAFSNPLRITETVIPVCLWSGDYTQHQIENKTGIIVGFGQTESGEYSNILREARILVVDLETCRAADKQFYAQYLSANSFCAGNISTEAGSAISPCFGDSGGGIFFKKSGTEIWELRGIISTSQPTIDHKTCVPWVYAIFTDIAKFKDWIIRILFE